jgi:hypothetical protein
MSFNNLLLALALTVLWPLVLMGVLAAAEWLERRTLTAGEVPRGLRPAAGAPPEPVQTGVAGADAGMAASWAGTGQGAPAGTLGGSPDGARGPLGSGGLPEPADSERAAARRPVGGGGRHLRRT